MRRYAPARRCAERSARAAQLRRLRRHVSGQEAAESGSEVRLAAEEARHRRVRLQRASLVRAVPGQQLQEGAVRARLALR